MALLSDPRDLSSHLSTDARARLSDSTSAVGCDRKGRFLQTVILLNDHHPNEQEINIAAILYCRTSTIEQTIEHQLAQAIQAGFHVDEVVSDPGTSGVTTKLEDRPQEWRLYDKLRIGDTLVVWWVDRLGRN